MNTLWQDIRYGFRMLWKSPGFTVAAVLALALGIGANTAIFSVVNAVLLRPLGYKEPERLVTIGHHYPMLNLVATVSSIGYHDYKSQNTVFEDVAASEYETFNLTEQGEPERLVGRRLTANYLPLLGVNPALGRTFLPQEEQVGQDDVVVLSHGLWQRRFGASSAIIGKTVLLNNRSYEVIGVAPASYQSGTHELWTPLALTPDKLSPDARGVEFLNVLARLKPGVTIERAQSEMSAIAGRIKAENPDVYPADWGIVVNSLHEQVVGDVRPALLVLLGAVGFVLLIACSNVANLMLARAALRRKEITIRASLGAGRLRLVRQMLTESLLLAMMGGAGGLLLAAWGIDVLLAISPDTIPRSREIGIDSGVLAFTLGVSVLTGLLFGMIPAIQASKVDLNESLKEGGRSSTSNFRWRSARSLLIVTEIAVTLVLLVGAGLLLKSFTKLLDTNPGFQTENVLTMQVSLPPTQYPELARVRTFYQRVVEGLRNLPGVEAAGAISNLPLSGSGGMSSSFDIEGETVAPGSTAPHTDVRAVASEYLQTMKIPLLKGRVLTERDNAEAPLVALIDETLARLYFRGQDPVGKRIRLPDGSGTGSQWREVVGIVGAVKHKGLDAELKSQVYLPHGQSGMRSMYLVMRSSGDPLSLTAAARAVVRSENKDLPVYGVRAMREVFHKSVAQKRFSVLLLSVFAFVALVLAAVGLYGVIAYSVTQRTHEIGLRMALGAQRRDVLRLILGQGLKLILLGVGLGLLGAFTLTRVMMSQLYGVSPTDPLTFASIALLLAIIGILACYIPARRAMRVDPMVALRYE